MEFFEAVRQKRRAAVEKADEEYRVAISEFIQKIAGKKVVISRQDDEGNDVFDVFVAEKVEVVSAWDDGVCKINGVVVSAGDSIEEVVAINV